MVTDVLQKYMLASPLFDSCAWLPLDLDNIKAGLLIFLSIHRKSLHFSLTHVILYLILTNFHSNQSGQSLGQFPWQVFKMTATLTTTNITFAIC